MQPELRFQGAAECRYFDRTGRPAALPLTADCLGLQYRDRCYGLFAPDGTRFLPGREGIDVIFAGKSRYLVLCPLPARKDLAYFHRYAFAIPRDSKLTWKYDAARGTVTSTWTVTTEILKGNEPQVIQGWLPHHYRRTMHDLAFNKLEYLSPRGRSAAPRATSYDHLRILGILPNLPAPILKGTVPVSSDETRDSPRRRLVKGTVPVSSDETWDSPRETRDSRRARPAYDPGRMRAYLEMLAAKPKYGDDTYWGGKDILRMGQDALMAQQTGDPTYRAFVEHLARP